MDVFPLGPDRLQDFLAFFDGDAFRDHPEWGFCYCQCFLEDHARIDWNARTGDENRALACARVGSGTMQGFLAYEDGEVIGWCNAAPRRLFHALDDEEPGEDVEHTGTVLCFLIHPDQRGRGVARTLLQAACDGLRDQGIRRIEANPRPSATSAAQNHWGPMSLYVDAGFTVRRHDPDGSVWVEKTLGP